MKQSMLHLTHLFELVLPVLLGLFSELRIVERSLVSWITRFYHQHARSLRT